MIPYNSHHLRQSKTVPFEESQPDPWMRIGCLVAGWNDSGQADSGQEGGTVFSVPSHGGWHGSGGRTINDTLQLTSLEAVKNGPF